MSRQTVVGSCLERALDIRAGYRGSGDDIIERRASSTRRLRASRRSVLEESLELEELLFVAMPTDQRDRQRRRRGEQHVKGELRRRIRRQRSRDQRHEKLP